MVCAPPAPPRVILRVPPIAPCFCCRCWRRLLPRHGCACSQLCACGCARQPPPPTSSHDAPPASAARAPPAGCASARSARQAPTARTERASPQCQPPRPRQPPPMTTTRPAQTPAPTPPRPPPARDSRRQGPPDIFSAQATQERDDADGYGCAATNTHQRPWVLQEPLLDRLPKRPRRLLLVLRRQRVERALRRGRAPRLQQSDARRSEHACGGDEERNARKALTITRGICRVQNLTSERMPKESGEDAPAKRVSFASSSMLPPPTHACPSAPAVIPRHSCISAKRCPNRLHMIRCHRQAQRDSPGADRARTLRLLRRPAPRRLHQQRVHLPRCPLRDPLEPRQRELHRVVWVPVQSEPCAPPGCQACQSPLGRGRVLS